MTPTPKNLRFSGNPGKRRALAVLYSALVLAYLGFLLYFLTLRPGGPAGNQAVIWAIAGFASGGMMMMAIYALTLYLFRRGEKAELYFALFCFATGIRFLVMEGSLTLMELVPGVTYGMVVGIRYPAIGLQLIGVASFILEIFAAPKHKKHIPPINAVAAIAYIAAVILTYNENYILPVNITLILPTISIEVYCIYIIAKSAELLRNRLNIIYLASLLLYVATSVFAALLTDTIPHLAVIASTVFVVAHIVLLSDRYARAITAVERANEVLEEKVAERTAELQIANNRLAERNAMLDGLNRTKTEFLQDMSHEMKNPLTVIATGIDFADMQISEPDGSISKAHNALGTIREETQRLGRMVGGMVNLAAMSVTEENRKRVDFAALISNNAEVFRIPLEQQKNSLTIDIAPGMPDVFIEDDKFTQVMTNLLSNAANHTRSGLITVRADFDSEYITARVTDTGDGVPPDILPRVFERGVSGRDAGQSGAGTGYGLYICKTIVEAHGGTIKIDSIQNEGTTVTFTVPVYGGQEAGHNL